MGKRDQYHTTGTLQGFGESSAFTVSGQCFYKGEKINIEAVTPVL